MTGDGAPSAKQPSRAQLFSSFLRLGLTAFGGPAMVAYIRDLAVTRKGWIAPESFKAGAVLAQSIPGATAMQVAAYVGLRARGVTGALAAYAGFGLPAFVLMLALSSLYVTSRNLTWAVSLLTGLQVMVVAIVANATYTFGRTSLSSIIDFAVAAIAAAAFWFHVSPFFVIAGAAVIGLLVSKMNRQIGQEPKQQSLSPALYSLLFPVILLVAGLACLYRFHSGLFDLALLMLKVDLFAFGGGFASVPLMLQQVVTVRGWLDSKTFMDGIALGQITPGPIVITATFVGYLVYGLAGAFVATVAIFTPSFLLLLGTAPFFDRLKGSPLFAGATHGVLASFVGLLLYVAVKFGTQVHWGIPHVCLAAAVVAAQLRKIDLLYVVLVGATVSVVLF